MSKKNTTSQNSSVLARAVLATGKRWWLLLAVVAVVVLINAVRLDHLLAYNSDDVAIQNIAASWQAHGVSKAWVGTDNFALKLPFYFLMNNVIADPVARTNIVSGIFLIATFVLFGWWLLRVFRPQRVLPATLVLLYLASSGMAVYLMRNPNVRNIEIPVGFWLVSALFILIKKQFSKRTLLLTTGLAGLIGIFIYNDPFFLYMLFIPLALFFLIEWLRPTNSNHSENLLGLGAVGAAFVVSKIVEILADKLGFVAYSGGLPGFTALTALSSKVSVVVGSYLNLFRANFFGRLTYQAGTMRALAGAIIAALVLVLAYQGLRHFYNKTPRTHREIIVAICSLGVAVDILIFALTDSTFAADTRYLILLPFFATVLLLDFLERMVAATNIRLSLLLVLVFIIAANVLTGKPIPLSGGPPVNVADSALINTLVSSHYQKGYAAYWEGNVTSYFSRRKVIATPITCTDQGKLGTYYWLVSAADFRLPASRSFLVYNTADGTFANCPLPVLEQQFGRPTSIKRVGNSQAESILFFNYDIRTKFVPTIPSTIQKYGQ